MGPFCRIHGIGPREPWYFSEEAEEIVKEWLAIRYRLLPYFQRQVIEATISGLPVMRGMPLAFPEDRRAWGFELQYMKFHGLCTNATAVWPHIVNLL